MKYSIVFLFVLVPLIGFSLDYNVVDFGATPDDESDDSQAFRDAILASRDNGTEDYLFVPVGAYVFDQAITVHSGTLNLRIIGDGAASTRLISRNTDGVFKFTGLNKSSFVKFSDLGFLGDRAGAGEAIEVVFSKLATQESFVAERIDIRGADLQSYYFNAGIRVVKQYHPLFSDVIVSGVMASFADTEDDSSILWKPYAGLYVRNSRGAKFIDTQVLSTHYGIHLLDVQSNSPILIERSIFVTKSGVYVNNNKNRSGVTVDYHRNHNHPRDFGLKLVNIDSADIRYNQSANGGYEDRDSYSNVSTRDFSIIDSQNIDIVGNMITFTNENSRQFIYLEGSDSVNIERNIWEGHGPVLSAIGSTNIVQKDNLFGDLYEPM